jgi:SPP1 family predicted phage head-tail adaptor
MREKITIMHVTAPYDGSDEGTEVSLYHDVWAKVTPTAGGLVETTLQEQTASQTYDIWIRYLSGVKAWQQIKWQGQRLVMTAPPESFDRYGTKAGTVWMLLHAVNKTTRTI